MSSEIDVWRTALEAKGRDWVLTELRTRPGYPNDPLYEVVYEPPYPTREFCQRWCVEDDNRLLHISTSTKAALCALVVFILVGAMGINKLSSAITHSHGGSSHSNSSQ